MTFGKWLNFILVFAFSGLLRAEDICLDVFAALSPPVARITALADGYKYFKGADGKNRRYKDGVIQEEMYGGWATVARARLDRGKVIELPPESKPARARPPEPRSTAFRTLYEAGFTVARSLEMREFPNAGVSYPSFVLKVQIDGHRFDIIVPQNLGEPLAESILQVAIQLPVSQIRALKEIRANSRSYQNDAHYQAIYSDFVKAGATAWQGAIDLYGSSLAWFSSGSPTALWVLRHEIGHLMAESIFGSAVPDFEYLEYARRDAGAVSSYATNSAAEDFAETARFYIETQGGRLDPDARIRFRYRFSYFDRRFH